MGRKKSRVTNKNSLKNLRSPTNTSATQNKRTASSVPRDTREQNQRGKNNDAVEVVDISDSSDIDEVPLEGTADGVFVVDKILDKKITEDGAVHYYLQWLGYGPEYDTWEPEKNLACADLIAKFEEEYKQRPMEPVKQGFERGLKPIGIIGLAVPYNGGPKEFVVRWEGTTEVDLVPMSECKEKIPQLVIQFYSDRCIGFLN